MHVGVSRVTTEIDLLTATVFSGECLSAVIYANILQFMCAMCA